MRQPKLCCFKTKILQVSCGYDHSLMLGAQRQVFGMGSNEFGQLSLMQQPANARKNVTDPQVLDALRHFDVAEVSAGVPAAHQVHFSFCLTADNKLFSWGKGDCGQLGRGVLSAAHSPSEVSLRLREPVDKLRCGNGMTFVLTAGGAVYCCGDNSQGGLGMGEQSLVEKLTPHPHFASSPVVDVQVGDTHTLYLKEDGKVLVSGANSHGQLGCSGCRNSKVPVSCQFMEGMSVKLIAAGHFSLCVTRDDELYIWGMERGESAPIKCSLQARMSRVQMRHKSGRPG